jgi:hypothetical protein
MCFEAIRFGDGETIKFIVLNGCFQRLWANDYRKDGASELFYG